MRRIRIAWLAVLLIGVTGCRHRPAPVLPVQAHAPVALDPTQPRLPSEVAKVPAQPVPIATVELPKKKPHHPHHKGSPGSLAPDTQSGVAGVTTPVAAPPPVQVASATPPPPIASVIGSLSTGGEAGPEIRQQATDLITTNEKRVKALSKQIVEDQRPAVMRVTNFDRDAETALKTGDAQGALTMAKKAQVLLEDLEK